MSAKPSVQRVRADVLLVSKGHFSSREKAREAIEAGLVTVANRPVVKVAALVDENGHIEVRPGKKRVSRGAHKLEGALDALGISVEGMRAMDAGASTGGFTEVLLERGVVSVAAVDVGYGQLAWALRQDPRVTVLERQNVRHLQLTDIGYPVDLIVADLSFISLSKVMEAFTRVGTKEAQWILLIKPQFEVGKGQVGKGGIVRDEAMRQEAIDGVEYAARSHGMHMRGCVPSDITGADGNQEYLGWFVPASGEAEASDE